ncbi:MAG: hypothetical protein A2Y13_00645 [Planctomycetes bacterium GWC2_45_44]|nr:MAG: hypothetical protein A2Y13_00645 [Planctomycetes bacterium GWC2_45_44]HBR19006.1 hypothetical protein [Phycisphaerales bacterium]
MAEVVVWEQQHNEADATVGWKFTAADAHIKLKKMYTHDLNDRLTGITMKQDVFDWANTKLTSKVISKESLNHPQLIEMVSGLDVYKNTPEAYRRAYQALGIDVINNVPLENAPSPTPVGRCQPHAVLPYSYGHLGVFDTFMRHTYLCKNLEEVWDIDVEALAYEDLLVPVPHSCKKNDIVAREKFIGEIGSYYPMLYTTLFMWAEEFLGWEIFMVAAALEPDRFHDKWILPFVKKSKAIIKEMALASDNPFVFVHDDLANANGPLFHPQWYDDYIFPHYPEIFGEARRLGKKIIYVADGNMETFFPKLLDIGVDGIHFENPATPLDSVIEYFGKSGKFLLGGIETIKLTLGTSGEIRQMVFDVMDKMQNCPGYAMTCCGGLHGNIPMENLEAYFDARAEVGVTPKNWRTICRD